MTKSILIVEDDPFIAMDLQDMFESAGFEVLGPVASVSPGIEIIKNTKPDFAMLDYNLGEETSIPIAQFLDGDNVPYAFLSGQIHSVINDNGARSARIITKPFRPEGLVKYVDNILSEQHGNQAHTA